MCHANLEAVAFATRRARGRTDDRDERHRRWRSRSAVALSASRACSPRRRAVRGTRQRARTVSASSGGEQRERRRVGGLRHQHFPLAPARSGPPLAPLRWRLVSERFVDQLPHERQVLGRDIDVGASERREVTDAESVELAAYNGTGHHPENPHGVEAIGHLAARPERSVHDEPRSSQTRKTERGAPSRVAPRPLRHALRSVTSATATARAASTRGWRT
jgi:hypothetical protein